MTEPANALETPVFHREKRGLFPDGMGRKFVLVFLLTLTWGAQIIMLEVMAFQHGGWPAAKEVAAEYLTPFAVLAAGQIGIFLGANVARNGGR